MTPLLAVVNYDKKELELITLTENFKWDLNDGDVGDFWHSFTDWKGVIRDVNFHQEDENQKPSLSIYPVKEVMDEKTKKVFLQVDTSDETILNVAMFGDVKNYFD